MQEKYLEIINNNIHKRDNLLKENQDSKQKEITGQERNSIDDFYRLYLNPHL